MRFVSGFLLPRYEESGQQDETSDIHLSTHGLDCQIRADARGELTVNADFSIYVRVLPTWEELTAPQLDMFPNPPLRRDLEQTIRDTMKRRLATEKALDEQKPPEERRNHRELQQELYHAVLTEHGVHVSSGAWVADEEEPVLEEGVPGNQAAAASGKEDDDTGEGGLIPQRGRYVFDNDAVAQPIDIPQKWHRLRIPLDPLTVELSDRDALQATVDQWTRQMRAAVNDAVAAWLASDDGMNWAYRQEVVRPSHFRSKESWKQFLVDLRKTVPSVNELAPNLDGLLLTIGLEPDLRDKMRLNLRVILENNSTDAPKRKRHLFEHAVHQTQLTLELPATVHQPLKLDRVEPSYRFRDFLTYPAIGVNCGVTELHASTDRLRLATTWMPRYQQPRIVPQRLDGVPTRFAALGAAGFDPHALRNLITAYNAWIDVEERTVDPVRGAESSDDADRERAAFRQDIHSYRREAERIALGIELLELSYGRFVADPASDEAKPYKAWLLLNRTFAAAGADRGIDDWRLFQLAFVLAHIPTIASRMPAFTRSPWFDPAFDEETATLLYFPTGGGKSEAFFGLLVFNLFLDRLRGKEAGITALIRYPLRLLTLQQAQRLLAILMRADLLRRETDIDGAPFEIGFLGRQRQYAEQT